MIRFLSREYLKKEYVCVLLNLCSSMKENNQCSEIDINVKVAMFKVLCFLFPVSWMIHSGRTLKVPSDLVTPC